MEFQFIAGFGPIGPDAGATHDFWSTTLGIPFEEVAPDYFHGVLGRQLTAEDALAVVRYRPDRLFAPSP